MNVTAVETLERRLKATRDAMAGELERARNAAVQAAAARERANEHAATITALEEAIEELRGWAPAPEPVPVSEPIAVLQEAIEGLRAAVPVVGLGPLDVPCPSCGARIGDRCRAPSGEAVEPHATRGTPT